MGLATATREGVCIILGADGTAVGRCMVLAGCALHDEQHVAYDVEVAPSSTFHSGDKALLVISPPGTRRQAAGSTQGDSRGTHFAAPSYILVGSMPSAACGTLRIRRGMRVGEYTLCPGPAHTVSWCAERSNICKSR